MRRAYITLALAAAVLVGLLAAPAATEAGTQGQAVQQETAAPSMPANLAGRWELNAIQSDESPDASGASGEGGRGGRGGGRGGYGGGMGGSGRGMGGRDGGSGGTSREPVSARDEIQRIMRAPVTLVIVQQPTTVSITDDEGRAVTLTPDGVKVEGVQSGVKVERRARWDGRTLVAETKLDGGTKVTQRITKVNEGLQLIVATRMEGGRLPRAVEFKRVYDQAFESK